MTQRSLPLATMILAGLLLGACEIGPGEPSYRCILRGNDTWQAYLESIVQNPPCPLDVPQKGLRTSFVADFEADNPRVIPDTSGTYTMTVLVYNEVPEVVTESGQSLVAGWIPSWGGGTRAAAFVDGYFYAGTCCIGADTNHAYDTFAAGTVVYTYSGSYSATAEAIVRSMQAVRAQASVVASAEPYQWVTATATASNYAGPISYSWTVNGASACGNTSSCSAQVGDYGSYTTFQVTITDSEGDQGSSYTGVGVPYPECPECMAPGIGTTHGTTGARTDTLRPTRPPNGRPPRKH